MPVSSLEQSGNKLLGMLQLHFSCKLKGEQIYNIVFVFVCKGMLFCIGELF